MRREKLLKWFAMFFAAMIVFTFLSRAADSVSVAKVQVSAPQNQIISHTVTGTGKIEGTQETAVFIPEGQKIAQVHVKAGQAVKAGDVLVTLLESGLKESLEKKEDEIKELQRKISDLESQQEINAQKKSNTQQWAQADLDTALGNGNVNISNAQNELNLAQQRLQEYRNQKAAQEAERKAEAERKFQEQLKAAEENSKKEIPDFSDGVDSGTSGGTNGEIGSGEGSYGESGANGEIDMGELTDESDDFGTGNGSNTNSSEDNHSGAWNNSYISDFGESNSKTGNNNDMSNFGNDDSGTGNDGNINSSGNSVTGSDNSTNDSGNDTSDSNNSYIDDSSTEQALEDAVRAVQNSLNQSIMSRNQEVTTADRAKADAAIPDAQDSTGETLQDQLDTLKEDAAELNILISAHGEIKAPADGVLKSVAVQTGGQTTLDAAVVLYQLTGELSMTGTVTKDDLDYVSVGSPIKLEGTSKTVVEDAKIQSLQEDTANPGTWILTASVPESGLSVGERVDFTVSRDEGPYNCCVPLSAIYGAQGQEYVLVLESRESVLGEIQVARKVSVTVADRNASTAALQEGSLSSSQKVITGTDREIDDGSRVRLQDS